MRKVQLIALLVGAVLVALGVGTLVSAEALAGFLAGAFLALLSLPFLALGGVVGIARGVAGAVGRHRVERAEGRVERYLRAFPRSRFEEVRDDLDLPEEDLTRALERLLEARRIVEDYDAEREAFVYAPRSPHATDVEVPVAAPPPDAPPELLSVRERVRRLEGGREARLRS